MIYEQILPNFQACQKLIENDFGIELKDNKPNNPYVLLRGESCLYEKTESSMNRFLTEDDGVTMKSFYYVSPFIDFEDIYSEYHYKLHGLSEDEGRGFLQHYGFPTDLFDLTPSIDIARFFASYANEDSRIGVVGVFLTSDLRKYFNIVNLSKHPFAERPRRQCAYSANPLSGSYDLKDTQNDELFKAVWYKYCKNEDDYEFSRRKEMLIYPTENELLHFFSNDLCNFVREHWAYEKMTQEQRYLIEQRLMSIRNPKSSLDQ